VGEIFTTEGQNFACNSRRWDDVEHVFYVQRVVMHTQFAREGEIVNSKFCLPVQKWLCERISELRRQFGEKCIWFLVHNNAPANFVTILKHFLANRDRRSASYNAPESRQLCFSYPVPRKRRPSEETDFSTKITSRRLYPHN
jgi:hypothetical protein